MKKKLILGTAGTSLLCGFILLFFTTPVSADPTPSPTVTPYCGHLSIGSTEGGSVVTPGEGMWECCVEMDCYGVHLVAVPEDGYVFTHWTCECVNFWPPWDPFDCYCSQCDIDDLYSADTYYNSCDFDEAITAHFAPEGSTPPPTATPPLPTATPTPTLTLSCSEIPICINTSDQLYPDISCSIVVWEDMRNGNKDIYGYDLSAETEFPICLNSANQTDPHISGDMVVWYDYRNGNGDIYGYNISNSSEFAICTNLAVQGRPDISGDIVVWHDSRNGTKKDIYGYNLSNFTEFPIAVNSSVDYCDPAISGDIVVWQVQTFLVGNVISGYNLSSATPFTVASGTVGCPEISRDIVIYFSGSYLYGYNISNSSAFVIDDSTLSLGCEKSGISRNYLVWQSQVPGEANNNIYGYDLFTSTKFTICADAAQQYAPDVSGKVAVWHDNRNGNYDIYGYGDISCPPPTPTPSLSPTLSVSPTPSISLTPSPTPTAIGGPGDVNTDGVINCLDITQVELCILYPGLYPKEDYPGWDADENGEGPNSGDVLAVELRILELWPP